MVEPVRERRKHHRECRIPGLPGLRIPAASAGQIILVWMACTLLFGFGCPGRAAAVSNLDYNRDAEGPRGPYHDSPVNPALNTLDVYLPQGGGTGLPVMVYVHGGAWQTGDKAHTAYKDELFTGRGWVFVSVNYRLSPDPSDPEAGNRVMFPDHPRDVAEAVRYVYDNVHQAGGDNDKIFLLGHSAGAHLVALVATDPGYLNEFGLTGNVIKGVCPLDSAAYDIPARLDDSPSDLFYNAFGTPVENDLTGSWTAASPVTHAGPGDPPFFLVTQEGPADRVWQNEALAAALGLDPSRHVITVNRTHAEINGDLGSPDDPEHITEAVTGFFDYVLTGAPCADTDGDGYGDPASPACTGAKWDCDDGDNAISPGLSEDCGNGVDDDCDSLADDQDPECAPPPWGAAATARAESLRGSGEKAGGSFQQATPFLLSALMIFILRILLLHRSGRRRQALISSRQG